MNPIHKYNPHPATLRSELTQPNSTSSPNIKKLDGQKNTESTKLSQQADKKIFSRTTTIAVQLEPENIQSGFNSNLKYLKEQQAFLLIKQQEEKSIDFSTSLSNINLLIQAKENSNTLEEYKANLLKNITKSSDYIQYSNPEILGLLDNWISLNLDILNRLFDVEKIPALQKQSEEIALKIKQLSIISSSSDIPILPSEEELIVKIQTLTTSMQRSKLKKTLHIYEQKKQLLEAFLLIQKSTSNTQEQLQQLMVLAGIPMIKKSQLINPNEEIKHIIFLLLDWVQDSKKDISIQTHSLHSTTKTIPFTRNIKITTKIQELPEIARKYQKKQKITQTKIKTCYQKTKKTTEDMVMSDVSIFKIPTSEKEKNTWLHILDIGLLTPRFHKYHLKFQMLKDEISREDMPINSLEYALALKKLQHIASFIVSKNPKKALKAYKNQLKINKKALEDSYKFQIEQQKIAQNTMPKEKKQYIEYLENLQDHLKQNPHIDTLENIIEINKQLSSLKEGISTMMTLPKLRQHFNITLQYISTLSTINNGSIPINIIHYTQMSLLALNVVKLPETPIQLTQVDSTNIYYNLKPKIVLIMNLLIQQTDISVDKKITLLKLQTAYDLLFSSKDQDLEKCSTFVLNDLLPYLALCSRTKDQQLSSACDELLSLCYSCKPLFHKDADTLRINNDNTLQHLTEFSKRMNLSEEQQSKITESILYSDTVDPTLDIQETDINLTHIAKIYERLTPNIDSLLSKLNQDTSRHPQINNTLSLLKEAEDLFLSNDIESSQIYSRFLLHELLPHLESLSKIQDKTLSAPAHELLLSCLSVMPFFSTDPGITFQNHADTLEYLEKYSDNQDVSSKEISQVKKSIADLEAFLNTKTVDIDSTNIAKIYERLKPNINSLLNIVKQSKNMSYDIQITLFILQKAQELFLSNNIENSQIYSRFLLHELLPHLESFSKMQDKTLSAPAHELLLSCLSVMPFFSNNDIASFLNQANTLKYLEKLSDDDSISQEELDRIKTSFLSEQ
ncbi:MAG: hypothetical protein HAW62_01240 [Endozoicomonadaceae bacterium]|nr:hypothetical protein [Endozoicomonadaceae bacterium]